MRSSFAAMAVMVPLCSYSLGAEQQSARAGQSIVVEVTMADASEPIAAEGADSKEMTAERIKELMIQGKLSATGFFRLQTLDQSSAKMQFGERIPVQTSRSVAGPSRDGARPVSVNYSIENTGTMLNMAPHIEDGAIVIDFELERSVLVASPAPADDALTPHGFATITVKTTVRVPAGKTVVMEARQNSNKEARHTWILLSASVLPSE